MPVVRHMLWVAIACVAVLAVGTGSARADTATVGGLVYSYTPSGSSATVTGCSGSCPASVAIPATVMISAGSYSVTGIGNSTFAYETSLAGITIPTSVTSIGDSAFLNATSLASVTFASPSNVTAIGPSAFRGATSLTSIAIPDSVTIVGAYSFFAASGLTSITIGAAVTAIGDSAFAGGNSLTSIAIPTNVTSIGNSAFRDASNLTSVAFSTPSSLSTIGPYAFQGTTQLASVNLPESLTSIAFYAFANATSLSSVRFRGNAPSVGSNAFQGVPGTIFRFSTATGFGSGPTWGGRTLDYWLPAPAAIATHAADGTATIRVTPAGFGPTPDSYRVSTVSGAGICTITPPATSCTIDNLSNGATYTFTATASTTSPTVTSDASGPTNPITPLATPVSPPTTPTQGPDPGLSPTSERPAVPRATVTAQPTQTSTGIRATYRTTGPGRLVILLIPTANVRAPRAPVPTLCRAASTVRAARTVTMTCAFTETARKRLRTRSLRATLIATFTPAAGSPTRTNTPITLTRQR